MTIRFLQTVQSEASGYPFMAGQVISVPIPSPYLLSLLDGVRAEAIVTDDIERAIEPDPIQPEPARRKGRQRRVQRH